MFPNLGAPEMIIIMILGVLLFGKRLPEVGRSLGKGIIEFKKGLRGLEDELEGSSSSSSRPAAPRSEPSRPRDEPVVSVPKFEPPSAPPVPEPVAAGAPQPYQD